MGFSKLQYFRTEEQGQLKMLKIGCHSKTLQSLSFLHRFHVLSLYSSTSSTNKSFAEYLEQSLGFSKQQSLSTSIKLSKDRQRSNTQNVRTFNFSDNANYVLNFLKNHGFHDTHVRKIVSLRPRILLSNVDKTLKPKLDTLKEIGICGTHLVDFVCNNPFVLHRKVGPSLQPLRSVLGSDENVVRFLERLRMFFVSKVTANNLVSNARVLEREYGFCSDVIGNVMSKTPSSFVAKTDLFRSRLVRVEKELGIPRNSLMFFSGLQVLSEVSQKSFESKFSVYKDYGWTQLDVVNLFRQIPHCLALSEGTLRKKLDFFMKELGYEAAYLASNPSLLTYSLEKRVLPRHGILLVLKRKGLLDGHNFHSVVSSSEAKFLEKFVLPYEDVIPRLYELYLNSRGGAVDGSGKKRMFKSPVAT